MKRPHRSYIETFLPINNNGEVFFQVKSFSKAGKSRESLVTSKLQEHKELSTADTLGSWNTGPAGQNGRCGKKKGEE